MRTLSRISIGVLAVLLMPVFPPVKADDSQQDHSGFQLRLPDVETNGYFEVDSAYRLHNPGRFSRLQSLLETEFIHTPSDWAEFHVLTWLTYDAVYDIHADDYAEEAREAYLSSFSGDDPADRIFREIYLDIYGATMDVRVGRQQVVWGEAIGLRITDVINPQDFRDFILDDFIDSRIPLWMAKLTYYAGDYTLTGLWIPFFEPNRPAPPGSDWEWTFNRIDPPPGVGLMVNNAQEPENDLENGEYGARLAGLIGGWDLTLSYFYTWEDSPTQHVRFDPQAMRLTIDQQFHRQSVFGFTFANAFGFFVPRGEFSYYRGDHFSTADPYAREGITEKDYVYYMIGTDHTRSTQLFNVQFIQKVILHYDEAIYEDRVQNNASFWWQGKFINETLTPELLTIYDLDEDAWLIRPKITYSISDRLSLAGGFDIFSGPARSFLGQFDEDDRVYAKLKYSF